MDVRTFIFGATNTLCSRPQPLADLSGVFAEIPFELRDDGLAMLG
jgi:hypothetical protein